MILMAKLFIIYSAIKFSNSINFSMCAAAVKIIILYNILSLIELKTSLTTLKKLSADQIISKMYWIFVFASCFSCGIS
jgi:hypothetical protein